MFKEMKVAIIGKLKAKYNAEEDLHMVEASTLINAIYVDDYIDEIFGDKEEIDNETAKKALDVERFEAANFSNQAKAKAGEIWLQYGDDEIKTDEELTAAMMKNDFDDNHFYTDEKDESMDTKEAREADYDYPDIDLEDLSHSRKMIEDARKLLETQNDEKCVKQCKQQPNDPNCHDKCMSSLREKQKEGMRIAAQQRWGSTDVLDEMYQENPDLFDKAIPDVGDAPSEGEAANSSDL